MGQVPYFLFENVKKAGENKIIVEAYLQSSIEEKPQHVEISFSKEGRLLNGGEHIDKGVTAFMQDSLRLFREQNEISFDLGLEKISFEKEKSKTVIEYRFGENGEIDWRLVASGAKFDIEELAILNKSFTIFESHVFERCYTSMTSSNPIGAFHENLKLIAFLNFLYMSRAEHIKNVLYSQLLLEEYGDIHAPGSFSEPINDILVVAKFRSLKNYYIEAEISIEREGKVYVIHDKNGFDFKSIAKLFFDMGAKNLEINKFSKEKVEADERLKSETVIFMGEEVLYHGNERDLIRYIYNGEALVFEQDQDMSGTSQIKEVYTPREYIRLYLSQKILSILTFLKNKNS